MIRDSGLHSRGDSEALVDLGEGVIHLAEKCIGGFPPIKIIGSVLYLLPRDYANPSLRGM